MKPIMIHILCLMLFSTSKCRKTSKKKGRKTSHQSNPQTATFRPFLLGQLFGHRKNPSISRVETVGGTLRQVLDKMLSLVKVRLKKMTCGRIRSGFRGQTVGLTFDWWQSGEISKKPPAIYEAPMKNGIFSSYQLVIVGILNSQAWFWNAEKSGDCIFTGDAGWCLVSQSTNFHFQCC